MFVVLFYLERVGEFSSQTLNSKVPTQPSEFFPKFANYIANTNKR
jgi:hypothetical protein